MRMKKFTTQTGKTVYFSDGLVLQLLNDALDHSNGIESVNVIETEPTTFSVLYQSGRVVLSKLGEIKTPELAVELARTIARTIDMQQYDIVYVATNEKTPRTLIEFDHKYNEKYGFSWEEFM